MKADPFDIGEQDQARRDQVLCKHVIVDTFILQSIEIDARLLQQLD